MVTRVNLGQAVAEAWVQVQAEAARREELQVSTLHDWRRKKNGQWGDEGWTRLRPNFLLSRFLDYI